MPNKSQKEWKFGDKTYTIPDCFEVIKFKDLKYPSDEDFGSDLFGIQ